jgi:hypothetical protein
MDDPQHAPNVKAEQALHSAAQNYVDSDAFKVTVDDRLRVLTQPIVADAQKKAALYAGLLIGLITALFSIAAGNKYYDILKEYDKIVDRQVQIADRQVAINEKYNEAMKMITGITDEVRARKEHIDSQIREIESEVRELEASKLKKRIDALQVQVDGMAAARTGTRAGD